MEPAGVEAVRRQGPRGGRPRASSRSCTVRIAACRSLQQGEPQKRAQLENLRVAIPDEPNLAQFILDANTAANISGINFLSISPSPPAAGTARRGRARVAHRRPTPGAPGAGTPPAVINLQLSVSGGYFQVVDFVNRLNGLSRLVVIDSLGLADRRPRAPRARRG